MTRRFGGRDFLVVAALCIIALAPVRNDLLRSDAEPLGLAARIRVSWEAFNSRAFAEQRLPFWNPFHFGGRPHLANPDTLALYPPHVVLRVLPPHLLFPVSFWLHAWLAGIGAYLAARQIGASRLAGLLGSVAIMLGGVLAPREDLAYSPDVYRLAWLPLVVAYVLRSTARGTLLPHPGLVVVTAIALTASSRAPLYVSAAVLACYLFAFLWPLSPDVTRKRLLAQLAVLACVATGLTAFQLLPAARMWTSVAAAGEWITDTPTEKSHHAGGAKHLQSEATVAAALTSMGLRGRVLSVCDAALDGTETLAAGIPDVGGYGGVLRADYARFANLTRDPGLPARPVFEGLPEAGHASARADLQRFLALEHLVSCDVPDPARWTLVRDVGGAGIYRSRTASPRAFWTCGAEAVGREQMEYRLRRGAYDERMTLLQKAIIHVRWPADLGAQARQQTEAALHIVPQRDLGERTWQYELLDRSPANLTALVTHPLVEDTQGIDRGTRTLAPPPLPEFDEPDSEWLLGGTPCDLIAPATVVSQDGVDGRTVVAVDAPRNGLVFLSETYDPDRRVLVDGRRVEPLKVNFAFTAVPVTAGIHRIDLRYDTMPFRLGAGVSLLTLTIWPLCEWRMRRRSRVQLDHAHSA